MIKEILNKPNNERYIPSGKFSISSIGSCWRKKYLELKGMYKEDFTPETMRIFQIGNIFHSYITKELIERGSGEFHLVASEINIPNHKYISGRIDNILSVNGELIIIDVKSASDYTIKSVRNGEVEQSYKDQVLLYEHLFGIHRGMLLFVGKSKGELIEVMVEYNKGRAMGLVQEIEDFFINYVEKNIEPLRCNGGKWGCECCFSKKNENEEKK